MKKFVVDHKKKVDSHKHKCERCDAMYETKDELIAHKQKMHGDYDLVHHGRQDTSLGVLYLKFYGKKKRNKTKVPFNPAKVYNRWLKVVDNSIECGKLDDINGTPIDILYIRDEDRYRMYVHKIMYGDFLEVIYNNDTQKYQLKDTKIYKEAIDRRMKRESLKDIYKRIE